MLNVCFLQGAISYCIMQQPYAQDRLRDVMNRAIYDAVLRENIQSLVDFEKWLQYHSD